MLIWWGYGLTSPSLCAVIRLWTTCTDLFCVVFFMFDLRWWGVRIWFTWTSQSKTSKSEMIFVFTNFFSCVWLFATFLFILRWLINSHTISLYITSWLWLLLFCLLVLINWSFIHSLYFWKLKMIITAVSTCNISCFYYTLSIDNISAWHRWRVLFQADFWNLRYLTIQLNNLITSGLISSAVDLYMIFRGWWMITLLHHCSWG